MVERILNGNFSNSTGGTDADPVSWTVHETNELQVQVQGVTNRLVFNRSVTDAGSSIEQTIPNVAIGRVVNFSLRYSESGAGGDPSVLVEILDGTGAVIFSQMATAPQGTSVTHSFTSVTSTYTVRITDTSTGNITNHDARIGGVSFDVACFARGTLIETPDGPLPVEDIKPGQLVRTADNGDQPVRWIGYRKLDAIDLAQNPDLRPINISKHAFARGIPERDLIVSPQHRILIRSKIAHKMFGCDEILVAAKKLIGQSGVYVQTDVSEIEYYHFLFDHHEIVVSNGAESESLFFGPMALTTLGEDAVSEIKKLFPEIDLSGKSTIPSRPLVKGKKLQQLLERHAKSLTPLIEPQMPAL